MVTGFIYEKYHSNRKKQRRIIKEWDFTYRQHIDLLKRYLPKVRQVLDIGCGTGTFDFFLAQKGIKTLGVDISRNAIEISKKNATNLGLSNRTKFRVSDFSTGQIGGKFDLVICTEVLEHLPNDKKAIEKIYSLLKVNGIALFSSPLTSSILFKLRLTRKFDEEVGHLRRYIAKDFKNMIRKEGFEMLKIKETQGLFRDCLFLYKFGGIFVKVANKFKFFSDIFTFIDDSLLLFGASDIIVLARKI